MSDRIDSLRVDLGDRGYDILVGPGLIGGAGEHVARVCEARRVVILSDESVAPLYLNRLTTSLDGVGIAHEEIVVPPGEGSKSFTQLQAILDRVLDFRVDRTSAIIALGGGVVGDLAGFAAAVTLRGIDFIQIPTTLLSQVDSSVGGKTGINTRQGKNLVGAFHQPRLVLIDTDSLHSLPERELKAGYAEVVKYGLIRDAEFFDWLERHGDAVLAGDTEAQRHAILASCRVKAEIVGADEREAGDRALLNFGHTFGHAFEALAGYDGGVLHGEAVSVGMVKALELSKRMGLCPGQDTSRATSHLRALGLATRVADLRGGPDWPVEHLIERMGQDKKVKHGRLRLILARGIGDAFITDQVSSEDLRATLEAPVAA